MQGHPSPLDPRPMLLPAVRRASLDRNAAPVRPHLVSAAPQYVWFRLEPGADPVQGIAEMVEQLGAGGGSIVQCMGSLRQFTFLITLPEEDGGWRFSEPIVKRGPMEFVSAQGTWGRDEETGELVVHMHGLVVDSSGTVHGGHFVTGGSRVLVTCEIGLVTGPALTINRRFDAVSGFSVLMPPER